ncbi:MAG TPA: DnaD domain protein [Longilinea sp.]|nr:DnaD domain protein [Longilinea sp.]
MEKFSGFSAGKQRHISVPNQFFSEVLPRIDDLLELKVTLFILWQLDQQEGDTRFVTQALLEQNPTLMASLSKDETQRLACLQKGLNAAVERGTLLAGSQADGTLVYFLNTPRGRAAVKAISSGKWTPDANDQTMSDMEERPNIYRLYEENIGLLTPLIAEELQEAEKEYPVEWIDDAFRLAVQRNARNWRYISAILRAWKEKGRDETNRRTSEEDSSKYVQGDFGDVVQH